MNLAEIQEQLVRAESGRLALLRPPPARPAGLPRAGLHARAARHAPLVLPDPRPGRAARGWCTASSAACSTRCPARKTRVLQLDRAGGRAAKLLAGRPPRVAMQYSPNCAIPYVSMVDAGTVELVRSLGVEVVSSAELIQDFEARWTPDAAGVAPGSRAARGPRARRGFRADWRAHAQRAAVRSTRSSGSCWTGFAQGRDWSPTTAPSWA